MAKKKLIEYIKTELKQGYTAQQLKIFLTQKGYTPKEFDKAIAEIQKELLQQGNKNEGKSKKAKGGKTGKKEHQKPPIILIVVTLLAVSGLLISAFLYYGPLQELVFYENKGIGGEDGNYSEKKTLESLCGETIVDCGMSPTVNDCFIKEAKHCCPAILSSEFEEESKGIISHIHIEREILGIDEEKCYIQKRITNYTQEITESSQQTMLDEGRSIEEINEEIESKNKELEEEFIGQEVLCDYPDEELEDVLLNEKEGVIPPTIESYKTLTCPLGKSAMAKRGLNGKCLSVGDYFCAEKCPSEYNSILSGENCCLNPEHKFCTQ